MSIYNTCKKFCLLPQSYYTTNKNACLQGHFCAVVQWCGGRETHRRQRRQDLRSKASVRHYTTSKNACLQGHFCAAVQWCGCVKRIGGNAAKTCEARLPQKHYTIRQPQFQQTVQNQEQTQKSLSRKTGEGLIILFRNYSRPKIIQRLPFLHSVFPSCL